jgi:hypothetical protein
MSKLWTHCSLLYADTISVKQQKNKGLFLGAGFFELGFGFSKGGGGRFR